MPKQVRADLALLEVGQKDAVDARRCISAEIRTASDGSTPSRSRRMAESPRRFALAGMARSLKPSPTLFERRSPRTRPRQHSTDASR
jgi:hypothetical protein